MFLNCAIVCYRGNKILHLLAYVREDFFGIIMFNATRVEKKLRSRLESATSYGFHILPIANFNTPIDLTVA